MGSPGNVGHDDPERFGPNRPDPADKPKATPMERLRNNWIAVALGLVLLLGAGLFLWLRSATQAAQQNKEVVAAASENIEPEIKAAPKAPVEAVAPSVQMEQQRRQDQEAQSAPTRPNTDPNRMPVNFDFLEVAGRNPLIDVALSHHQCAGLVDEHLP